MNDEARIARLTQLARRVWPRRDPEAVEHEWHDGFPGFEVLSGDHDLMANDEDSNTVLAFVQSHPRALDALEAALLVLAGDDTRLQLNRLQEQVRDVLADELARRTPAWVERLARRWDELHEGGYNASFAECAQELREGARGQE